MTDDGCGESSTWTQLLEDLASPFPFPCPKGPPAPNASQEEWLAYRAWIERVEPLQKSPEHGKGYQ